MKIKTILFVVFSLISFAVFAQDQGGIKGKVVSRTTRNAIEGVKVTLTPGNVTARTDETGNFLFEHLAKGEYNLTFETADFESLTLAVRVDRLIRDLNQVILVPESTQTPIDDAVFAEFDTESAGDAQVLPSSLSASKDVFNNIASYKFSEMRFNNRGYDSQYSDVSVNGIRMNDAMTGYTPWSLWGGLNDATRNQEVTSGLNMGAAGIGGIGGTTNINTRASQIRKGFRASVVNANSMYRFRGMLTYASGKKDNGWSYALSVSTDREETTMYGEFTTTHSGISQPSKSSSTTAIAWRYRCSAHRPNAERNRLLRKKRMTWWETTITTRTGDG
ncbi:hypothetical protein JCM6294_3334 [Bacteroides pyogenes DSM 20611 = JCM 6294]|uniref:TonB-dependent receptor n=1 Tax=Bacteroides pyogenes DSM 20611 = JCM 6294 TaxID=1121100 RepID=W4PKE0_9BACE|nr:hypothetical protein JCM6294_3334 [Bacteroides pyogenes DSM 20611 = JCM 6294]